NSELSNSESSSLCASRISALLIIYHPFRYLVLNLHPPSRRNCGTLYQSLPFSFQRFERGAHLLTRGDNHGGEVTCIVPIDLRHLHAGEVSNPLKNQRIRV